jgi:Rps23 Pro-64 3,4-dihydroxylase Tpa1-like proline 4-hydroxylase
MCINPRYLKPAMLQKLRKQYAAAKPFPHLRLTDFFTAKDVKRVEEALRHEQFVEADADLFSFKQCNDLKHSKHPVLQGLRNYLRSKEFLVWLSYVTGENLSNELDLSGFIYSDTDHLLPHDDELEGRKIAFVINLSTLKPSQGGQLDLFKQNKIAKSYSPVWNSIVFFTVKPKATLHQVREVINAERVTLAGWFHGK